ncbi:MAG: Fe-S cluster assembly ATPase SufC [Leptospiraceae bacterium]|nr:Fe-S cluster assembly ATPase SufC [Leptospiraceae bacterium]
MVETASEAIASAEQATALLAIHNLHVQTAEREILKGIHLTIRPGEIHAIMGPNGSGKSTLAHVLAGNPGFTVTVGSVFFNGNDLLAMAIEERARAGLFVAFQYPPEIPGVNNMQYLRTAVNTVRKSRGQSELSAAEFLSRVRTILKELGMPEEMVRRSLNEGFSGGEKKKNEILQMAMLEPRLMVLDEIDSGLDVDALELVARCALRVFEDKRSERSLVVITHYSRILRYIKPQYVHVLADGKIVESGGIAVAERIEEKGYG